jgi:hypothetical protein
MQRKPGNNASPPRASPTAPQKPNVPTAAAQPAKSRAGGWLGLAAIIALLFAIGRCSSGGGVGSAADEAAAGNAQQAIVTAVQAQNPPPVQALSRKAVGRGLSHVPLALREGLAGEMIYSQNCYDALGRKFSWAKLDACGAFDAEAALALEEAEGADAGAEASWFQSEAAAGRFLKAATAAGEATDEADTRWSDLQTRVSRKHKAKMPAPAPSAAPSIEPDDGLEGGEALGNVDV